MSWKFWPLRWPVTEFWHMSGHVWTKSADFAICRIWSSFVAFWSVICIAGSIIGIYGYLGAIYSCPEVKVTQGHEFHWPFPRLISAVIFITLQLSWASGSLFIAKLMPYFETASTNWLFMTYHVSRSSKVIRGQIRSLTSNDVGWSFFSWGLFHGVSKCF